MIAAPLLQLPGWELGLESRHFELVKQDWRYGDFCLVVMMYESRDKSREVRSWALWHGNVKIADWNG